MLVKKVRDSVTLECYHNRDFEYELTTDNSVFMLDLDASLKFEIDADEVILYHPDFPEQSVYVGQRRDFKEVAGKWS
jgi:hypothetical protein